MKNNNVIGGYFGLETSGISNLLHPDALALNTGRNALEYVLIVKKIQKIYLPYFTCDVLLEPLRKLKISFEFYCIDHQLEPVFDFSVLKSNDAFLYTNYFGLKDSYIKQLSLSCEQLIIDNAQSFYSKPHGNESTIYSARKFFGVADGAYLYCNNKLSQTFKMDSSSDRMSHLLIRNDISAEAGYANFITNDKLLKNQPIKKMSSLTNSILGTINYEEVAIKRFKNYRFLENFLKNDNQFSLEIEASSVPMVFPFWTKDKSLKKRLLENKIYTPTYWPNVIEWCESDSFEFKLTSEVVYLPIDQRYSIMDMKKILEYV